MKQLKKLPVFLATFVLCFCMSVFPAFAATTSQDGFMSATDKTKLDTLTTDVSNLKTKANTLTSDASNLTLQVNGLATEVNNLKSTVVNGKQIVANAINDKFGTTLSNASTYDEIATAINNTSVGGSIVSMGSLGTTSIRVDDSSDIETLPAVTLENVSILGIGGDVVRIYCTASKPGKVYYSSYVYDKSFTADKKFILGHDEDSSSGNYIVVDYIIIFEEPATVNIGTAGAWHHFSYTKIL